MPDCSEGRSRTSASVRRRTGGRLVGQVADFAGQIADAAGPGELRDSARLLVRSMRRGVVSYAPEMDADEGDDLTGADLP